MDIIQLYNDFSIPYATEGHKHCRPGYVNTECPHCTGNPGLHLSFNLQGNYFVCWRCGWHPINISIAALLHISETEANKLAKQYGGSSVKINEPKVRLRLKPHHLPSHSEPMTQIHRQYLEGRGFDPERLEYEWKLLGTGPISTLDNLRYNHRIIIPFIWNGEQVSFDSRDITGKANNKYMACPLDRELIPHKDILYGDQTQWHSTGICVEGPTDVWRFGPRAFATSGIKYKPKQIRAISQHFKRVAVVFDGGEIQAQSQARKLVAELKFRGVDAFRVDIEGDPGGMKQSEADYLVKQLL